VSLNSQGQLHERRCSEEKVQRAQACRMGPFCLHPATEDRSRQDLKMENDTRGDTQVILILRACAELVETR
jgi:hypothetical protein